MTLKEQIGENIKLIRKKRRVTQQELADKLEMNVQNISQIERGVYSPSLEKLLMLSKILNCTPNEILLGRTDTYTQKTRSEDEQKLLNIMNRKVDFFTTAHEFNVQELLYLIGDEIKNHARTKEELIKIIGYFYDTLIHSHLDSLEKNQPHLIDNHSNPKAKEDFINGKQLFRRTPQILD